MQTQASAATPACSPPADAPSPLRLPGGPIAHLLMIGALFFAAIGPTLSWLEFDYGMEKVSVATALETYRDGQWLVPTLNGEPRLKKPPLTHWLGAIGLAASNDIQWGARWPTLLCSCVFLGVTYALARILADRRIALAAACICGTSYLFLRYGRQASYDVPLALFVGLANLFIALALLRGRWWLGMCGAGITIGLAIMTKGPVALAQTIAPAILFVAVERLRGEDSDRGPAPRSRLAPVAVGILLMLLVALPWYVYLAARIPGMWDFWLGQVTLRTERNTSPADPWYNHLQFIPMMAPWTLWLIVGCIAMAMNDPYRHGRGLRLALWLLVVPIVIMSFFHAKPSRYLLPMLAPASIIAAWGIFSHLPGWISSKAVDRVLAIFHWIMMLAVALALPIGGSIGKGPLVLSDGTAWYTPMAAATMAVVGASLVLFAWLRYRTHSGSLVLVTTVLMLGLQLAYYWGYSQSSGARAHAKGLAEKILAVYPDALMYNGHHQRRDPPLEMQIYMNRIVKRQRNVSKLKPEPRPQVILVPSKSDAPQTPPGFEYFDRVLTNDTWWYAFVRTNQPPAAAAAQSPPPGQ